MSGSGRRLRVQRWRSLRTLRRCPRGPRGCARAFTSRARSCLAVVVASLRERAGRRGEGRSRPAAAVAARRGSIQRGRAQRRPPPRPAASAARAAHLSAEAVDYAAPPHTPRTCMASRAAAAQRTRRCRETACVQADSLVLPAPAPMDKGGTTQQQQLPPPSLLPVSRSARVPAPAQRQQPSRPPAAPRRGTWSPVRVWLGRPTAAVRAGASSSLTPSGRSAEHCTGLLGSSMEKARGLERKSPVPMLRDGRPPAAMLRHLRSLPVDRSSGQASRAAPTVNAQRPLCGTAPRKVYRHSAAPSPDFSLSHQPPLWSAPVRVGPRERGR